MVIKAGGRNCGRRGGVSYNNKLIVQHTTEQGRVPCWRLDSIAVLQLRSFRATCQPFSGDVGG